MGGLPQIHDLDEPDPDRSGGFQIFSLADCEKIKKTV
jgi:queuine/archaeosine tRNA-ribosyltransferase